MTTLQTVQQFLAEELERDVATLDPVSPLEDLGIDSLAVIECMFKLEDRFGVIVANHEAQMKTLQDIADLIDRLVAGKDANVPVEAAS